MNTTYRIKRVSDPRSRGLCYWFEVEGRSASGARWQVGIYDKKDEALAAVRAAQSVRSDSRP
jgi:hypothetical protein